MEAKMLQREEPVVFEGFTEDEQEVYWYDEKAHRDELIVASIKFNGCWEKITDYLNNHTQTIPKDEYDNILSMVKSSNVGVVTVFDDNYPIVLKDLPRKPYVLFYCGNIDLIDLLATKSVGVIGKNQDAVDLLVDSGNTVTVLGKDFVEIKNIKDSISMSTTFNTSQMPTDILHLFSSLCGGN